MSTLAKKKKSSEEPKVITDPRILQAVKNYLMRAPSRPPERGVQNRKVEKPPTALESAEGRSAERQPPATRPAREQNAPELEFPPPPLVPGPNNTIKIAEGLEPHLREIEKNLLRNTFSVLPSIFHGSERAGKEIEVSVPAVCRVYLAVLDDKRAGIGYLCTANAASASPDGEVLDKSGGFYLLDKPLRFSIYSEVDVDSETMTVKCAGMEDKCLGEIRSALNSARKVEKGYVVPLAINTYFSTDGTLQRLNAVIGITLRNQRQIRTARGVQVYREVEEYYKLDATIPVWRTGGAPPSPTWVTARGLPRRGS